MESRLGRHWDRFSPAGALLRHFLIELKFQRTDTWTLVNTLEQFATDFSSRKKGKVDEKDNLLQSNKPLHSLLQGQQTFSESSHEQPGTDHLPPVTSDFSESVFMECQVRRAFPSKAES